MGAQRRASRVSLSTPAGGLLIPDAINDVKELGASKESIDTIRLYFDAPYESTDLDQFRKELVGSFKTLGMQEDSVAKIGVRLLPGSIIAEISCPASVMVELRSKP